MKTDWERPARLTPPLDAIRAVAGPVVAVEQLTGGRANTNLLLRTERGNRVLRLYQRDPASQAKEVALARALEGLVPVAPVLASGSDDGLGAPWTLLDFVEGVPMDALAHDPPALAQAARSAGRTLAAIAAQSGQLVGDDGPRLTSDACAGWVDGLLGSLDEDRLSRDVSRRVARLSKAWVHLLDERTHERSLVHCDYNGANLLIRDGVVVAVLDWEFAISGTPLWDLANMVRHYAAQDVTGPFSRGYGRLPERWREQAALLDIVNLMDMLTKSPVGSNRARSMALSIAAHLEAVEGSAPERI